MGKHAVKRGTRAVARRKNGTSEHRVVKSSAVSMVGLLVGGVLLAPHSDSAGPPTTHQEVSLLDSIIFIDGHDYPYGSTRMADELTGQYQYQSCAAPCTHLTKPAADTAFVFVNQPEQYPGTLGLIDGPSAPTGDQSVDLGQTAIEQELTKIAPSATNSVTVVGYSEGAVAASHEVSAWLPTGPVAFVLIGDPERPNGGILARMPAGTYIPVLGITGGNATPSTGAPVVMVTREYDGVADAPVYVLNVVADLNALLGAYYLHGKANYFDVDPSAAGNVITTSPDGNMTDILVPAAPGALPLFIPLAQAGVPQPILVALDPAVRAIIDTGYDRTGDPSQQVRFALLPPPSAVPGDLQLLIAGFTSTSQQLPAALAASLPAVPGLPVVTAPTTVPSSAPVPRTPAPVVPQLRLASHAQPPSQVQQGDVAMQRLNEADPDATDHATGLSPKRPTARVPSVSSANRANGPDTASGRKVPSPSSNAGGSSSSIVDSPPSANVKRMKDGISLGTVHPKKARETVSSSSHAASQSDGS